MSPTTLPDAANTDRPADRLRRELAALIEAIEEMRTGGGLTLGHIPRHRNPVLARLMDAGKQLLATVAAIDAGSRYASDGLPEIRLSVCCGIKRQIHLEVRAGAPGRLLGETGGGATWESSYDWQDGAGGRVFASFDNNRLSYFTFYP